MTTERTPKAGVVGLLHRRRFFGLAAGGGAAALLAGCSLPVRGTAVPIGRTTQASVLGVPNERFFPFYGTEPLEVEFSAAADRQRRALGLAPDAPLPEVQFLAVSGGGENGAFGAGLLCGWSEHGTRPVFELVTGVSTGALTAPFAYLGSSYDPQLRAVYTDLTPSRVLLKRCITAALFDDAMTDNAPLFKTISDYLDEAMLAALARAYQDGRLLIIGTTDLDAQQPVIWNIGAIASSGHPRALDTIRRILLASAAIPGAFPPTMFDVTLDGEAYQEMHVDGGAFAQAFLYPAGDDAAAAGAHGERPVCDPGGRLCHPQWPPRPGVGEHGAAHAGHRRARHRHHDLSQRHKRRDSHVQHDATRRHRLQSRLYRPRLYRETARAIRPGLYARPVRLWLPTCPARLRLGEAATNLAEDPRMFGLKHFSRTSRVAPGTNLVGVPFGIVGAVMAILVITLVLDGPSRG